jgi:hypothetical protein
LREESNFQYWGEGEGATILRPNWAMPSTAGLKIVRFRPARQYPYRPMSGSLPCWPLNAIIKASLNPVNSGYSNAPKFAPARYAVPTSFNAQSILFWSYGMLFNKSAYTRVRKTSYSAILWERSIFIFNA